MSAFITDTRHTLEGTLAHLILSASSTILLARSLGIQDFGFYTFCIVFVGIVTGLADLGVTTSAVYHVARERDSASQIGRVALELTGILSLAATLAAMLVVFLLHDYFAGMDKLLLFACLLIPVQMLLQTARAILKGISSFFLAGRNLALGSAVQLVLVFILVWTGRGGILEAIIARLAGDAVALGVALYGLHRKSIHLLGQLSVPRRKLTSPLFSYGMKSHLGAVFTFLNYRLDKLLLTALSGPATLGIYEAAVSLAERLWLLSGAAAGVLFSRVASLRSTDRRGYEITPILSRNILWVSLIASIPIFALAEWIITLVFGPPYQSAGRVLQCMLPGVIVVSMARLLGNDLSGRGRPGLNSVHAGLALVVNVVSNLLLIPRYEALGAALATTISYSFLGVIKVRAYARIADVKWYQTCVVTRGDLQLWWRLVNQRVLSRSR